MVAWITARRAEELEPGFFAKRGENSWAVDAENRRIHSRFGFAEVRVQTKQDGSPDFDRVVYGEAPNVNAVVWGKDTDGTIKVAVTVQARPFADMTDGSPAETPIVFGQPCVMGFLNRIVGASAAAAFERADDGAVREAIEEAGIGAIQGIREMDFHNPNPTFCATWSHLLEIEVDLTKVSEHTDQEELIYRAEYISLEELFSRIANGEHNGVNYRSATANDAFLVWFTKHFNPSGLMR